MSRVHDAGHYYSMLHKTRTAASITEKQAVVCQEEFVSGRARGERALASRTILHGLADRTHRFDFGVWFLGDSIAFDGVLDAADLLDESRHASFCKRFIERWQSRPFGWTDYLAPGLALVRLIKRGANILPSVQRLLDLYLIQTPRGDTGL